MPPVSVKGFHLSQTIEGLAVAFIFIRREEQARASLWATLTRPRRGVCLPGRWLRRCSCGMGLTSAQALCAAHALPQDAGHPSVRWSCVCARFTGGMPEALMTEQVPSGSAWRKH